MPVVKTCLGTKYDILWSIKVKIVHKIISNPAIRTFLLDASSRNLLNLKPIRIKFDSAVAILLCHIYTNVPYGGGGVRVLRLTNS